MASYDTMHFFKILADKLLKRGHSIRAFPAMPTNIKGGRYSVTQCNWHNFELDPLEQFNPDRIIVWNGYHNPFHGAVCYLKEKYDLIHVEMAWLPQRGNLYFDTRGIGSKSSIATYCNMIGGKAIESERAIFKNLQMQYAPSRKPKFLPEKYVAVPLQLELDTSIVFDSPYFKTMNSLIGYALKMSPYPVVIKPHPKDTVNKKNLEKFKNISNVNLDNIIIIDKNDIDMSSLAAYSSGLIGINSTSMIEAALHLKPLIQLGMNVFRSTPFPMWENKRAVSDALNTEKEYYEDTYIKKIAFLYKNQVSSLNPPEWVLRKIENFDHELQRVT